MGSGVKYVSGAGNVGFASLSRLGEATAAYEERSPLDQEKWRSQLSEEDIRNSSLFKEWNHNNTCALSSARHHLPAWRNASYGSHTHTAPRTLWCAICAGVMSEAGV